MQQTFPSFWQIWQFARRISPVFYLALTVALALIALNEYGYHKSRDALDAVNTLEEQRLAVNHIHTLMLDAEASQRGYLLTGEESYLGPYNTVVAEINAALDKARSFYDESPETIAHFAQLSRPVSRKMAEMEVTVKLRRTAPAQVDWIAAIHTGVGNESMDEVRKVLHHLSEMNRAALLRGSQDIRNNLLFSRAAIALVALVAVLAFYFFLRQLERSTKLQDEQQSVLAAERDALDRLVRERTKRMTELANHLLSVQETERAHLARELHDEMGALFTAAKLDLSRIRSRLVAAGDEVIQKRLQHLNEALNAGISLKRRIIEDLMPSTLTNLGLHATLEIQAREFEERTGIETETLIDEVQTNRETSLTIFRLLQEGLNNITKYAEASRVSIILQQRGNVLDLRIQDNGKGFDVQEAMRKSHGLPGMLHRVEALSGSFRVHSAIGKGTSIQAILPKPLLDTHSSGGTPPVSGLQALT